MYFATRGAAKGKIASIPLYNSLDSIVDSILIDENDKFALSPALETNQIIGAGISSAIPVIPVILLWLSFIILWPIWCCCQCCQCCCCNSDEPCCYCGCWSKKKGVKPCCRWCTKITFCIFLALSLFFGILATYASFKLPSLIDGVPKAFNNFDESYNQLYGVIDTLNPIIENGTTVLKSILELVDEHLPTNEFNELGNTLDNSITEIINSLNNVMANKGLLRNAFPLDLRSNTEALKDVTMSCQAIPETDEDNVTWCQLVILVSTADIENRMSAIKTTIINAESNESVATTLKDSVINMNDTLEEAMVNIEAKLDDLDQRVGEFSNHVLQLPGEVMDSITNGINTFKSIRNDSAINSSVINNMTDIINEGFKQLQPLYDYYALIEEKYKCATETDQGIRNESCKEFFKKFGNVYNDPNSANATNGFMKNRMTNQLSIPNPYYMFDRDENNIEMIIAPALDAMDDTVDYFENNLDMDTQLNQIRDQMDDLNSNDIVTTITESIQDITDILASTSETVENGETTIKEIIKNANSTLEGYSDILDPGKEIYNDYVKAYEKYPKISSYTLGGIFIFISFIFVLEAVLACFCPNSKCLCCCECTQFTFFAIFGFILLIFALIGGLLGGVPNYIYGGDLLKFITSDAVGEYIVDKIPFINDSSFSNNIKQEKRSAFANLISKENIEIRKTNYNAQANQDLSSLLPSTDDILNDIDLDLEKVQKIITCFWNGDDEQENPLNVMVDKIFIRINDVLNKLKDEEQQKLLIGENYAIGTELKNLIIDGVENISNSLNPTKDAVTNLLLASKLNNLVFSFLDPVTLDFPRKLLYFYLAGLWLFILFWPNVCCLGCGRNYWPKSKAEKAYLEQDKGRINDVSRDDDQSEDDDNNNNGYNNYRNNTYKDSERYEKNVEMEAF